MVVECPPASCSSSAIEEEEQKMNIDMIRSWLHNHDSNAAHCVTVTSVCLELGVSKRVGSELLLAASVWYEDGEEERVGFYGYEVTRGVYTVITEEEKKEEDVSKGRNRCGEATVRRAALRLVNQVIPQTKLSSCTQKRTTYQDLTQGLYAVTILPSPPEDTTTTANPDDKNQNIEKEGQTSSNWTSLYAAHEADRAKERDLLQAAVQRRLNPSRRRNTESGGVWPIPADGALVDGTPGPGSKCEEDDMDMPLQQQQVEEEEMPIAPPSTYASASAKPNPKTETKTNSSKSTTRTPTNKPSSFFASQAKKGAVKRTTAASFFANHTGKKAAKEASAAKRKQDTHAGADKTDSMEEEKKEEEEDATKNPIKDQTTVSPAASATTVKSQSRSKKTKQNSAVGNADDFVGDEDDATSDEDEDSPQTTKTQSRASVVKEGQDKPAPSRQGRKRKGRPKKQNHAEEEEEEVPSSRDPPQDSNDKQEEEEAPEEEEAVHGAMDSFVTSNTPTSQNTTSTKTNHPPTRRVLKDKTYVDEKGYLRTEKVFVMEEVSQEELEKERREEERLQKEKEDKEKEKERVRVKGGQGNKRGKTSASSSSSSTGNGGKKGMRQAGLMGFFAKKTKT